MLLGPSLDRPKQMSSQNNDRVTALARPVSSYINGLVMSVVRVFVAIAYVQDVHNWPFTVRRDWPVLIMRVSPASFTRAKRWARLPSKSDGCADENKIKLVYETRTDSPKTS